MLETLGAFDLERSYWRRLSVDGFTEERNADVFALGNFEGLAPAQFTFLRAERRVAGLRGPPTLALQFGSSNFNSARCALNQ